MVGMKSRYSSSSVVYICVSLFIIGSMIAIAVAFTGQYLGLIYLSTAVIIIFSLFCAVWSCREILQSAKKPSLRRDIPAEYQSMIPTGFQRLRKSESQKTKMAARKPIPGVSVALSEIDDISYERTRRKPLPETQEPQVKVLRGGEFIGNRMRFKVKITNDSPYVITDVTVFLLSYPKESLRFVGDDDNVFFAKIEPGGYLSPTFDFLPTQDCVRGEIVAGVSFLDMQGNPQLRNTKPFIIRSVCDLLLPQRITPQDFKLKLNELECGEVTIKIEEWTPEEMFEKALRIVDESNFFEVNSEIEKTDEIIFAKIIGFALGKYTGKEVGVEIDITGPSKTKGASCKIKVSGEDHAMILPAIDDLRERLNAWLCPMCSSPLSLTNVEDLKEGKVVVCPFCNVTIGR
ncbi:MAG: hypothetical protein ACFFEK_03595 [Candidatus Thorarchaeota archaeon]